VSFTVRPCTPQDVWALIPYVPNWPRAADHQPRVRAGWAFVAELDGYLVAGAGMDETWPGVGYAWLVVIPGAQEWCARALARALKRHLPRLIHTHRLWRVEANVHCQLSRALRLVEWLGFKRECIKEKWGPDGKDYHQYALITEEYLP
jgi:hypothetical protein